MLVRMWCVASFPGHSQILSHSGGKNSSFLHSCEIKSGSGLGTRLCGAAHSTITNHENYALSCFYKIFSSYELQDTIHLIHPKCRTYSAHLSHPNFSTHNTRPHPPYTERLQTYSGMQDQSFRMKTDSHISFLEEKYIEC